MPTATTTPSKTKARDTSPVSGRVFHAASARNATAKEEAQNSGKCQETGTP